MTTPDAAPILIIAVSYNTPELASAYAQSFLDCELGDAITLVIADNSLDRPASLHVLAEGSGGRLRCHHYPHNPMYLGAAREALLELAVHEAPFNYRAVVLSNVDLSFSFLGLTETVTATYRRTGGSRWILAPKIIESGRRYLPNPHVLLPPTRRVDRRAAMRWYPSWRLYRQLYRLRRRLGTNPNADLAAFTPMYSAYGACVVFGAGYFAAGGVIHEGPLFGEEFGFAEQARLLEVPVLYAPMLEVHHAVEASTSAATVGSRVRFDWQRMSDHFYLEWDPAAVTGEMTAWFDTPSS